MKILLLLVCLLPACASVTDPVTGKVTRSLTPEARAALDRIAAKALDLGVTLAERKLDQALKVKADK